MAELGYPPFACPDDGVDQPGALVNFNKRYNWEVEDLIDLGCLKKVQVVSSVQGVSSLF